MIGKLPDHIDGLVKYITQPEEKANEDLILKYFRRVYGDKFSRQREAKNSDGHVPGHFLLELKGKSTDWLSGLFQGIAYQRELDFSLVVVAAKSFLAVWKVEDIDESIREEILTSTTAPSTIGKRLATKYKSKKSSIIKKALWKFRSELAEGLFQLDAASLVKEIKSLESTLQGQKQTRRKITTKNFTSALKEMTPFFQQDKSIKAVRAFYSMVFGWTEDSRLEISQKIKSRATLKGEVIDDIIPAKRVKLKSFVDSHYISLDPNENVDDFFAKYDEALDAVDPDFRRRHGIYFTDLYLSKFVMWFIRKHLGDIGRNYLVVDPACGSGNLVTNWRSPLELRHKVVSEIEPELLYTVERRMKGDAWHNGKFTVVPKVSENKGLNFLDRSATEYIKILKTYLRKKGHAPDKPLAFLCNPPYRSDDDQTAGSIKYQIHSSILELTKKDASAERYCCFLAQMKLICKAAKDSGLPGGSLLLLFTKASWLTKRPVFERIRQEIVGAFENIDGFIVNGKEFFDVSGKFPIAFTIWRYVGDSVGLDSSRSIPMCDLTWLRRADLVSINWDDQQKLNEGCSRIISEENTIFALGSDRPSISQWSEQKMVDFKRNRRKWEVGKKPVGGLPKADRRQNNKKAYGETTGKYIGFMDDLTPCRIGYGKEGRPWFRLNKPFMDCRKTRCFSGPPDQKGYCAENEYMAQKLFLWFALGRTFASHGYPMWVDADEMWPPDERVSFKHKLTKICFSIGFAENECVETVFPGNEPLKGAIELVARNSMTPLDSTSFWSKFMAQYFQSDGDTPADNLVMSTIHLFQLWEDEFISTNELYVDYDRPYFIGTALLTRTAGLIQIKDYAKECSRAAMLEAWEDIQQKLRIVKDEFNQILERSGYFGAPEQPRFASVIPFEPKTKFDKVLNLRLALAATIVEEMKHDPNFGRVKFTKMFYLADQLLTTDLKTEYYKEAAGPLDQRALYHERIGIEALAERYGYFSAGKRRSQITERINYKPGPNLSNLTDESKKLFGKEYGNIRKIVKLLEPLDTRQCEIIATLYACWNDLLLAKKKPQDSEIIQEFRNNWHMSKTRFSEKRLSKALDWMRVSTILPLGRGKITMSKIPQPEPAGTRDGAG